MTGKRGGRREGAGRPAELKRARRVNLYVEASFVEELARLAAFLSEKTGRAVSPSRAAMLAVRSSPQFRSMLRSRKR
jgi:hypothetical protein